jgi:ACT domain-containing protein
MALGLVDRPGQLLKALEPIAKYGGNIISIIHEREKITGGYVPVSLVVDFPAVTNFEKTKIKLDDLGISIIKSEEIIEKAIITFILIGRLEIRKIVETEIEGARIMDFEVSTPTSKEACVRLNIEAPIEAVYPILNKLKEVAKEENSVLISSV